jgi:hypothetical protein
MPSYPRRIMANMLLMSAFEVGNPVEKIILMKTYFFNRNCYLSLPPNVVAQEQQPAGSYLWH